MEKLPGPQMQARQGTSSMLKQPSHNTLTQNLQSASYPINALRLMCRGVLPAVNINLHQVDDKRRALDDLRNMQLAVDQKQRELAEVVGACLRKRVCVLLLRAGKPSDVSFLAHTLLVHSMHLSCLLFVHRTGAAERAIA